MTRKRLTDEELDTLVVRALSRLPAIGPSPAFGQRVMARVHLPQPYPVLALRRARVWVSEPRRALALASAYIVVATAALAVTLPWLIRHVGVIGGGFDWVTAQALGAVRALAYAAAELAVASGVTRFLSAVSLRGPALWAVGAVLAVGYAGGLVGLRFLLRAPRARHVAVHVDA